MLARVQSEWSRRVVAEYRSASVTLELTHWLVQIAAPPELIRAGLRIVDDELAHSELSHDAYVSAGGAAAPALPREGLALRSVAPQELEAAIARVGVETFCLGETVAVRLFSELRDGCDQAEARAALDRILKDEVTHRAFGWSLFEWLLGTDHGDALRALVRAELGGMFARLQHNYGYAKLADETPRASWEAHWGLMPVGHYARALEETFVKDYQPLFAELEIDAQASWQLAKASGRGSA